MSSLVIGTGFIGSYLTESLRARGADVTQSSRLPGPVTEVMADGPTLDRLLNARHFDQVVVVGQLTGTGMDWILQRIDGPRWVVMSSHQLDSIVKGPGYSLAFGRERRALGKGACVLRPTMVYGAGRDQNVSRVIRLIRRFRTAILPGAGQQHVQPVHVEDLADLVWAHSKLPQAGLHPVAGPEALPLRELAWTIGQVLGRRYVEIKVPIPGLPIAGLIAPLLHLRPDQLLRLTESRTVLITETMATFDWRPAPLGIRLEQACREVEMSH